MSNAHNDLPEPMTTPDCDMRGLPYMPFDVANILISDLVLSTSGAEFKAAILLRAASWNRTPAASLPDDPRALAKLAGVDFCDWDSVKDRALDGWVKCSDGLLYHPQVAERAMHILPDHQDFQEKRQGAAARKQRERDDRRILFEEASSMGLSLPFNTKTSDLRRIVAEAKDRVTRDQRDKSRVTSHEDDRDVDSDKSQSSRVTGHENVTAIKEKKRNIPPNPPEGGDRDKRSEFDEAWEILHDRCRGPADLDESRAQWTAILASGAVTAAGLLHATKAMTAALERSGGRMAVQAFHRWLRTGKWRNWPTGAEPVSAQQPTWAGPAEIRNAIIAFVATKQGRRDEGVNFAVTWLDKTTTWSEVPQAIVCLSSTVEKKLRSVVGKMLADEHGVQVRMATVGEAA